MGGIGPSSCDSISGLYNFGWAFNITLLLHWYQPVKIHRKLRLDKVYEVTASSYLPVFRKLLAGQGFYEQHILQVRLDDFDRHDIAWNLK